MNTVTQRGSGVSPPAHVPLSLMFGAQAENMSAIQDKGAWAAK